MSRKISEFFKPKLEPESDPSEATVKHEEEGDFYINLGLDIKEEVQENFKTENKSAKLRIKSTKTQQAENDNKCNFCGESLSSKNKLMTHMRKFHSNEMKNLLNCQICDEFFFKQYKVLQHMKTKHFIDMKTNFECDFDGRIFATRKMLLGHMKSHQMTVKCEICEVEIKPVSMKNHKKSVHSTGQKFQCKICSKRFKSVNILKIHQNNHNKKFECEICKRKFPLLCYLNYHKKEYHENPGSFECEICGKKFNQKRGLRNHEKTHDKNLPKPLKCQRCDYATDRKGNYKKHQNFHERQDKKFAALKNPLKCEKCSTFCRDKRALVSHMKYVHPTNLFQCDLCGKYIKMFDYLKKHLKNHQNLQKY